MKRPLAVAMIWLVGTAILSAGVPAGAAGPGERKPRQTMFIGVDTSGSFRDAGYNDAVVFLAYYIYGHLHELGGLAQARELFVAAIGGKDSNEPKAFHPIHDFAGKDVAHIEADLRTWFPPSDTLTDFNAFFGQVARIAKERNLLLTPITVMVVSDGIPDVPIPHVKAESATMYQQIDLSALEYLSKNVTIRLIYASPKVGDNWRKLVPHKRVRLWAVEAEVMKGWREQIKLDGNLADQNRLWKWVRENVDYRVRSRGI